MPLKANAPPVPVKVIDEVPALTVVFAVFRSYQVAILRVLEPKFKTLVPDPLIKILPPVSVIL